MSNHLISEAYKRRIDGLAKKSVMVLLADKASDDGTGIWASKQTMADELGTTKQTIITTIKGLIADGLVCEIGQRRNVNGYTVEYAINVLALKSLPLVSAHADRSSTLTSQAALPVKHDDPTSQAALPKPSLNPEPLSSSNEDDAPTLKAEDVLEAYNDVAASCGLSKAKMTPERRKKLNARLRQYSVEDFTEAISALRRNPWLHGENDRGWRADFDFFLQPKSFTRLIEGSYDRTNAH